MEIGYFLISRKLTRMKKRIYMFLLASSVMFSTQAQITGSGFYRIKNASSGQVLNRSAKI